MIEMCSDRCASQVTAQIACDLDEEISHIYPMADTTIYITFPCISLDMHIKK
jgi:hypothetical protein